MKQSLSEGQIPLASKFYMCNKYTAAFKLCAVTIILCLTGCDLRDVFATDPVKAAAEEKRAKIEECKINIDTKVAEYSSLMSLGAYWPASLKIRQCSELMDEPRLKMLVSEAEIKSYIHDIDDKKTDEFVRKHLVSVLIRDYPEQGKKYEKLQQEYVVEANQRHQEAVTRASSIRRSGPPQLGITSTDVRVNGWGAPSQINTTTNSYGTHEQWVYPNGSYLYFDNDKLTSIQERN